MKRFRNTPKMFSKITSIFHSQSPNKHLQQDFITHWKAVTNFFMDNKDHHVNVDQTTLPHHLDQMIQILVEEECQSESGLTGPCLEYLLHHKALDTLYSLGRSDCPPGMKQVVLQFFTKILSRIKQPILPHINVYKPVQRLVSLCGEISASPAEQEEVQFICVLCAKLKADPYLVSFFIQSAKNNSSPVHNNSSHNLKSNSFTGNGSHFKILEALLSLMASNDSWVSVKACEAMMLCTSLTEPVSVGCILSSPVIECITSKLCTLYSKLPQVMEPAHVECIQAKWGWDFLCDTGDEVRFPGKRQMISFMSWLDYCDQLVAISQPDIGKKLACSIHRHFLQGMLQPAILQTSEHGAVTATSHLCQCVHLVSSPLLLNEFVYFILGQPSTDNQEYIHSDIYDRLIERCNHLCDELSITTLKLFEALLGKQHPYILDTLVLKYLANRSYVDFEKLQELRTVPDSDAKLALPGSISDDEQQLESPSAESVSEEKLNSPSQAVLAESSDLVSEVLTDQTSNDSSSAQSAPITNESGDSLPVVTPGTDQLSDDIDQSSVDPSIITNQSLSESPMVMDKALPGTNSPLLSDESQVITGQSPVVRDDQLESESSVSEVITDQLPAMSILDAELEDQLRVHNIVNSFLSILDEDCQSSSQLDESGYETYLREAHRQFMIINAQCQYYQWPRQPVSEHQSEKPFDEGPFLRVLLDRISHMLDQSYDVNLHVTSVMSKLALMPHPHLHEYLLDPTLPIRSGYRTLYKLLEKMAFVIKTRVKPIPDYHKKLITVRKQLIGFSDTYRRRSVGDDSQCLDNANALTGVIILEEFCKELAAIAFVKYHELAVEL